VFGYISHEKVSPLLLQEENDVRAPKEEAKQIVNTLPT
jgi:hypothetical protein